MSLALNYEDLQVSPQPTEVADIAVSRACLGLYVVFRLSEIPLLAEEGSRESPEAEVSRWNLLKIHEARLAHFSDIRARLDPEYKRTIPQIGWGKQAQEGFDRLDKALKLKGELRNFSLFGRHPHALKERKNIYESMLELRKIGSFGVRPGPNYVNRVIQHLVDSKSDHL